MKVPSSLAHAHRSTVLRLAGLTYLILSLLSVNIEWYNLVLVSRWVCLSHVNTLLLVAMVVCLMKPWMIYIIDAETLALRTLVSAPMARHITLMIFSVVNMILWNHYLARVSNIDRLEVGIGEWAEIILPQFFINFHVNRADAFWLTYSLALMLLVADVIINNNALCISDSHSRHKTSFLLILNRLVVHMIRENAPSIT